MFKDKDIRKRQLSLLNYVGDDEFIESIRLKHSWTSGENTEVYPIQEWIDGISIQLKEDNPDCTEWFAKVSDEYSDILDYCYVDLTDGSCPSSIELKYKHRVNDLSL